tara:strand:+ start:3096 stop:3407 length:312 start_codon:yes stop_codon:yes gene_type:complete
MRVFVGKTPWRIFIVDDIPGALESMYGRPVAGLDKKTVGYTDIVNKTILLKRKKSAEQVASTYFHELLHAACPEMSEKRVYHIERTLFKILWKGGWRPDILYR